MFYIVDLLVGGQHSSWFNTLSKFNTSRQAQLTTFLVTSPNNVIKTREKWNMKTLKYFFNISCIMTKSYQQLIKIELCRTNFPHRLCQPLCGLKTNCRISFLTYHNRLTRLKKKSRKKFPLENIAWLGGEDKSFYISHKIDYKHITRQYVWLCWQQAELVGKTTIEIKQNTPKFILID